MMGCIHCTILVANYRLQTLESFEWAAYYGSVFYWPMGGNAKNKKYDAGYGTFFIGGEAFSTI